METFWEFVEKSFRSCLKALITHPYIECGQELRTLQTRLARRPEEWKKNQKFAFHWITLETSSFHLMFCTRSTIMYGHGHPFIKLNIHTQFFFLFFYWINGFSHAFASTSFSFAVICQSNKKYTEYPILFSHSIKHNNDFPCSAQFHILVEFIIW